MVSEIGLRPSTRLSEDLAKLTVLGRDSQDDKPSLIDAIRSGERVPLRLGDMRSTMAGAGIPHIDVFGRHIEIAAEHSRRVGIDRLVEPSCEPIEPYELRLIK